MSKSDREVRIPERSFYTPQTNEPKCFICGKPKGKPPERCNGHYAGTSSDIPVSAKRRARREGARDRNNGDGYRNPYHPSDDLWWEYRLGFDMPEDSLNPTPTPKTRTA